MFKQPNTITRKASRMILAAAAAVGLGTATHAFAAPSDVLSITTNLTTGASSSVDNLTGGGTDSDYTSSHSYDITYAGEDLAVTSITTSTGTYSAGPLGNVVLNRMSGGNQNDIVFDQGTVGPTDPTLALNGPQVTSALQALSGNNLLIGADNVLNDTGNPNGNNTNIQRVDVIFPTGISASLASVFAIFDRGLNGAHDGFKIAAITQLAAGVPSDYGNIVSLATGSWGNTNVVPTETYSVTRKSDTSSDTSFHPSDQTDQPIGAVAVATTDLVSAGTKIYGFSLFADDVTAAGPNLATISDLPTNTTETNGGLDLVGTEAVLFTSSVPEPTSMAGLIGVAALLGRRRNNRVRSC